MLDLNEITTACEEFEEQYGHFPSLKASYKACRELREHAQAWLPALVAELREARKALEAMEAERDKWRMDWETASASLLNVQDKLEQAQAEIDRLRINLQLAQQRPPTHFSRFDNQIARALAQRIEEATADDQA